jgi:ketosteroid isomerase-like protein
LEILGKITDWNTAWNIKDYKLAAKCYNGKATFTNAFGDKRTGRQEVELSLKEVFSLSFVMSGTSETTNHSYQYITAQTILCIQLL